MKSSFLKIISTSLAIFLTSTINAQAYGRFYLGLDGIWSMSSHQYNIKTNQESFVFEDRLLALLPEQTNGITRRGQALGAGLNFGYKITYGRAFYIAPEFFYDFLNNSANDFYDNVDTRSINSAIKINNRYGIKLNLGYNLVPRLLNGFINFGVANNQYEVRWARLNRTRSGTKTALIYGAGFIYNVNHNWATKLSYDRQQFNIPYVLDFLESKVSLDVVKLGLVYSF